MEVQHSISNVMTYSQMLLSKRLKKNEKKCDAIISKLHQLEQGGAYHNNKKKTYREKKTRKKRKVLRRRFWG